MITHRGTVVLESDRLILRRFVVNDAEMMFRNWASDPVVTQFMTWPAHVDVSVSQAVLGMWVKDYERENSYQWAIVPKAFGEPIGSIGVVSILDSVQSAEIGYCIGQNWWHQGYTSEALSLVLRFLFEEVGFNRIQACHDIQNPNSGGVMRKCGMMFEGTLRQFGVNNQGIVDIAMYSILKSEWNP